MVSHNAFANVVTNTIQVGIGPSGIAVNPDTGLVYVANNKNNTISIINGTSDVLLTTIDSLDAPNVVAVNPVTNRIYVTTSSDIAIIDGSTNKVIGSITLGHDAYTVAVNSVTNKIYAGSASMIEIINGSTNGVIATVPEKSHPASALAVNPITNLVYAVHHASCYACNYVSIIDGETDSQINSIWVYCGWDLAVDSITNMIYVSQNCPSTVATIDGNTNIVNGAVKVGNGPFGIGVNPTTGMVYVANYWSDDVSIIDEASMTIVNTISVGVTPVHVAINPITNKIYISNFGDDTVSVIDGSMNSPSSPQNLSASATSSSQINLSWDGPLDNGGSPITGYQIERSADNGSSWSTIVSNTESIDTTYSDTDLASNTLYTYRVSAMNAVGTSPPSNAASATTLATLSVNSVDIVDNQINGIWMELRSSDGTTLAEGYSPISFDVIQGTQYSVYANNYMQHVFLHWDDGSTNPSRAVTPTEDLNFTATYTITTTDQILQPLQ